MTKNHAFTSLVLATCVQFLGASAYPAEKSDPLYDDLEQAMIAGDSSGAAHLVDRILGKKYLELGLKNADAGDYKPAAQAFAQALALDPENHRARLELGRAYFAQRDYEAAKKEFQAVLSSDPPLNVLKNIKLYLNEMDQNPASAWTWDVNYAVGMSYDDNVNVGPDSSAVHIAPVSLAGSTFDTLLVDASSEPQDAWGAFGYVSAFAENDIGERDAWRAFGGASYYRNVLSEETDFELSYASAVGGLRHVGRRDLAELPVRYEHLDRGHDGLVDVVGLHPGWVHKSDESQYWIGQTVFEMRDYEDDLDDLDAFYAEARASGLHYLGPSRNSAGAGASIFDENADNDVFSNWGIEVFATARRMLPWKLSLVPRVQYRWEEYDEREPLAPEDRRDHEFLVRVELEREITDKVSAVLADQYINNQSTFDLYDYDRNVVSVSLQGKL